MDDCLRIFGDNRRSHVRLAFCTTDWLESALGAELLHKLHLSLDKFDSRLCQS